MSKDKKRKFQAFFTQNQPAIKPVANISHTNEQTYHQILKHNLTKVFVLTFTIIVIFIGLYVFDLKTSKVTHFAEHISSYIIK